MFCRRASEDSRPSYFSRRHKLGQWSRTGMLPVESKASELLLVPYGSRLMFHLCEGYQGMQGGQFFRRFSCSDCERVSDTRIYGHKRKYMAKQYCCRNGSVACGNLKSRSPKLLTFSSVSTSSLLVMFHHISAQTRSGRGCWNYVCDLFLQIWS